MSKYEEDYIDKENGDSINAVVSWVSSAAKIRAQIFDELAGEDPEKAGDILKIIRHADTALLASPMTAGTAIKYKEKIDKAYDVLSSIPHIPDIINNSDSIENTLSIIAKRVYEAIPRWQRSMIITKVMKDKELVSYPRDSKFITDKTYVTIYPEETEDNCTPDVIVTIILPSTLDKANVVIIEDIMLPSYHYYSDIQWALEKVLNAFQRYTIDCREIAEKALCKKAPMLYDIALSSDIATRCSTHYRNIILSMGKVLSKPKNYAIEIDGKFLDLQFALDKDAKYYPDLTAGGDLDERIKVMNV